MFRQILFLLLIVTSGIVIYYNYSMQEQRETFTLSVQSDYDRIQQEYELIQSRMPIQFKIGSVRTYELGDSSNTSCNGGSLQAPCSNSACSRPVGGSQGGEAPCSTIKQPALVIDGQNLSDINLHFAFEAPLRGPQGPKGRTGITGATGANGALGKTGPVGYSGSIPYFLR